MLCEKERFVLLNNSTIWVQFFLQHASNFFCAHCSFRIQLSITMDNIETISNKLVDGLTVAASTLSVAGTSDIFNLGSSELNYIFAPNHTPICDTLTESSVEPHATTAPGAPGVEGNVKQIKRKIRRKNLQKGKNSNEGSGNSSKRNRSEGTPPICEPAVKRTRQAEPSRFVAILAQSNSEGFTEAQVTNLSAALSAEFFKAGTAYLPLFISAGMVRGQFEVVGANEDTIKWLAAVVPTLSGLWRDASICITEAGPKPEPIKISAFIANAPADAEQIFSWLDRLNLGLSTAKWRVLHRGANGPKGQFFIFGVDSESLAVLAKKSYKLFLGLARVTFNVMKK